MDNKNIQDFIDFQYKKLYIAQIILACIIQVLFTFLIMSFHAKKSILFYLPLFIDAIVVLILFIGFRILNEQKRTFLFRGCFCDIFCIMSFLFVAGFIKNYTLFFMIELLLLVIANIVAFVLGCHNIKKNAFNHPQKHGTTIIFAFSISGLVVGRLLFAIVEVPNRAMLFLLVCIILLFSFRISDLLRLYLCLCQEKGISNKFIKSLQDNQGTQGDADRDNQGTDL